MPFLNFYFTLLPLRKSKLVSFSIEHYNQHHKHKRGYHKIQFGDNLMNLPKLKKRHQK